MWPSQIKKGPLQDDMCHAIDQENSEDCPPIKVVLERAHECHVIINSCDTEVFPVVDLRRNSAPIVSVLTFSLYRGGVAMSSQIYPAHNFIQHTSLTICAFIFSSSVFFTVYANPPLSR